MTQSAFAIESMMDMLAEEINIDPVELRRKNVIRVGSVTNTGQKLSESVGLGEDVWKRLSRKYIVYLVTILLSSGLILSIICAGGGESQLLTKTPV